MIHEFEAVIYKPNELMIKRPDGRRIHKVFAHKDEAELFVELERTAAELAKLPVIVEPDHAVRPGDVVKYDDEIKSIQIVRPEPIIEKP